MSLRPEERFTATVEDYARSRPGYPGPWLDALLAVLAVPVGGRLVDLGAGTGISTRALLARGAQGVVGVEPNAAMRAAAMAEPGAPPMLEGTAEALPFAAGTVHALLAAQAFHWFRMEPTLDELARVLVPGGRFAAAWNVRASTPFLDAYEAFLMSLASYRAVEDFEEVRARLEAHPRLEVVLRLEAPHAQVLDRAGFLSRARSSSYLAHAERPWVELEPELGALFDAHAQDRRVAFAYRAVASVLRFRSR